MYEADRPPIRWKRHWIEQGSLSLVEIVDGFLKPPSDLRLRYSRGKAAPLKHLSALAEIPCLVLLGGSGVGKSHELQSLTDTSAENASETSCYIDLKGRSDSAAIEKALRGQTGFLRWEAGRQELVLILDSLDECQRRVGEVGGIICDLLRPLIKGRPRLRLRLGCRSSEWGTDTGRLFNDLFSQQSSAANPPLGIYHLERLTREQVAEAARHRGVDTDIRTGKKTNITESRRRKNAAPPNHRFQSSSNNSCRSLRQATPHACGCCCTRWIVTPRRDHRILRPEREPAPTAGA